MKRSQAVKLCLIATTTFSLSACEEPQTAGQAYSNPSVCKERGAHSVQECNEAFEVAKKLNSVAAPGYAEKELCEKEFGINNCNYVSGTSGWYWVPRMSGYFVGNAIGDYYSRTRPIYNTPGGGLFSPGGGEVRLLGNGKAEMPSKLLSSSPSVTKVQTRTMVVARGGFGTRSSRFSFGG